MIRVFLIISGVGVGTLFVVGGLRVVAAGLICTCVVELPGWF